MNTIEDDHQSTGVRAVRIESGDVTLARIRWSDGLVEHTYAGSGAIHIITSLSRGQHLEYVSRGRSVGRVADIGRSSVLPCDDGFRIIARGEPNLVHLKLESQVAARIDNGSSALWRTSEPQSSLEALAYRIAQAIWLGEAGDALFLSTVSEHAVTVLSAKERDRRQGGLSPRNVRIIRELIAARVDAPKVTSLTLQELASAADLSVFHFARAFKASFGISPYRFVLRRRLEKAKYILAYDTASIREVSARSGFSSTPHLRAAFRQELGLTPYAFRDLVRTQRGPGLTGDTARRSLEVTAASGIPRGQASVLPRRSTFD